VSCCEDLEKQNRLLHDQIEKLSDKVVAFMNEGVQGPLNYLPVKKENLRNKF
jgi:nucleoprotein TPR